MKKNKLVSPGGERRIPMNYNGFTHLTKSCVLYRLRLVLPYVQMSFTVLDLGCGVGWNTKYISLYCKKVYGIDISSKAIEEARAYNGATNIEWIEGTMHQLNQFKDNSIDLVVSIAAIEHIKKAHWQECLEEVRRVLKPGHIFVGTQGDFKPKSQHNPTRWHKFQPSIKDFRQMAENVGYKILEAKNFRLATPDIARPVIEGSFRLQVE